MDFVTIWDFDDRILFFNDPYQKIGIHSWSVCIKAVQNG